MSNSNRFGAPWLPDVFAVLFRDRHPVLHGNTDDLVRIGGEWMSLADALTHGLRADDVDLVGRLNVSDGLTFGDPEENTRFHELAQRRPSSAATISASADPESRARSAFAQLDARDGTDPAGDRGASLTAVGSAMQAGSDRLALIVDAPDLFFQDPSHAPASERRLLGELRRLALLAHERKHHLLFMLRCDTPPPAWLVRSVPRLEPVVIPLPDREERLLRLRADASRFDRGSELSADRREERCQELAALTDGLTLHETASLGATSRIEKISLDEPRRLVAIARFGRRDVPLSITRERARTAPDTLRRRLDGQDGAISAVTRALRAAASGIDAASDAQGSRRKPLFTLVFAGGTGVGKTELAKAVAELVFADERALVRFDMSEFQQEHEVARLIGAPPGYIGHNAGGQLTRAVAGSPSTLLLFDEIEKAHPRILDLFIHVIDDGRLTDGNGQTVDFTGTGIIFTTNLGAEIVYRRMSEGDPSYGYEELAREVRAEIEAALRPELVGRLQQGIVVFDALSPATVAGIARKSLERVVLSAKRQAQLEIELDEADLVELVERELEGRGGAGGMTRALVTGGRAIEAVVAETVAGALQEWIVENDPPAGTRLYVTRHNEEIRIGVNS